MFSSWSWICSFNDFGSNIKLCQAVKTVAERTSMRKKEVYSLALKKFGKQIQVEDEAE